MGGWVARAGGRVLLKGVPSAFQPAGWLAGWAPTSLQLLLLLHPCLYPLPHPRPRPARPPLLAGNAKKLLKGMQEGGKEYHFVEVMACPGGCIGGGGQPRSKDKEILQMRQAALYK